MLSVCTLIGPLSSSFCQLAPTHSAVHGDAVCRKQCHTLVGVQEVRAESSCHSRPVYGDFGTVANDDTMEVTGGRKLKVLAPPAYTDGHCFWPCLKVYSLYNKRMFTAWTPSHTQHLSELTVGSRSGKGSHVRPLRQQQRKG